MYTFKYTPKGIENGVYSEMCTPVFVAALFTTANRWKQPMCSSTEEWINGIAVTHHIESYLFSLKKNEARGWASQTRYVKEASTRGHAFSDSIGWEPRRTVWPRGCQSLGCIGVMAEGEGGG